MEKMAADLARLCREERITKAFFVGVSIGGYALFEFWRRYREQVAALVLANTRAAAETPESRANRLALADKVLREGTAGFIEDMLPKLLSPLTITNRPDIVDAARRMMQKMSPQDIAGVQQGMADRPDSIATLKTIDVPTLIVTGADDSIPRSEAELMRQTYFRQPAAVIPRAGHYAALEQPEEFGRLLRGFLRCVAAMNDAFRSLAFRQSGQAMSLLLNPVAVLLKARQLQLRAAKEGAVSGERARANSDGEERLCDPVTNSGQPLG